ncbi:MAG: diaminobutyrate--2-oxoglutarate transaminase, partial [Lachnospiraceae bacterium]|nr:diaminobutyrate--2-oxoglutarate transaminase [Lachnospiraceae bacterium]
LDTLDREILRPRNLPYKVMCCGSTGTNAVEAALKLCRKVKKRNNVFAFSGAFHGMTLGSLAMTGDRFSRAGAGTALTGVTFMPYYNAFEDMRISLDYLEQVLRDDHSGIDAPAAIFLETVQAEGGINPAPPEWLKRLRQICDDHEILMVVDDIQVGVGRTGSFFSFERADIVPDMVVLSKSISGFGLPMSVLLMKPEWDIFRPAEHNGTFRGNQLAFVGAKAGMEYFNTHHLEDVVRNNGKKIEAYLREQVVTLDERIRIRGIGMIWGVDFAGIDPGFAAQVSHRCFDRGLVIELAGRNDSVLKILPPLTIEEDRLKQGLVIIREETERLLSEATGQNDRNNR